MSRARAGMAALTVTVLLAGCGSGADDTVDGFVQQVMPDGSSGTLVAVADGETVLCHGWGDADRGEAIAAGCGTVYDVMSITKQFTAAAVLKLQMQDRLQVTDSIAAHLDAVPPDKAAITIHHLLTHTAGLVESLGGDYEAVTRDELVAGALGSPLASEPGSEYHYSNLGYSLLAVIVEEASGLGYEEYLAAHLFEPAGMSQTGYVMPEWSRDDVAVEYDADDDAQGRPFDHPWADDGPHWNLRGNGGMLSTAADMARWHLALEGDQVLDDDAKRQLFEPWVREEPDGDTYYAYGWVIFDLDGQSVAWHNGANDWSYAEIARLADSGVMVFWATNQSQSTTGRWNFEDLAPQITEGVIERLADGT